MKMRVQRLCGLLLALAIAGFVAGPTRAQPKPPDAPAAAPSAGIAVAGGGEVNAKPTVVEINGSVSGNAELAADAIVKYRDSRRRAMEALNNLKLEGLKVESGGFAVNQGFDANDEQQQMQIRNGIAGQPAANRSRVTVSEPLTIVLSGLDKLKDDELMDTVLKVIDTARDAGLQIGPRRSSEGVMGNVVAFKVVKLEALREQAYKAAMDDAQKRAGRLAALAGVTLGRVVSVRDATQAGSSATELSSAAFKEIPIKVSLAVQFEIGK